LRKAEGSYVTAITVEECQPIVHPQFNLGRQFGGLGAVDPIPTITGSRAAST